MTIKKRLFLSNILMIIIPVILCILMSGMLMLFFRYAFGLEKGKRFNVNDNEVFYEAIEQLQQITTGSEKTVDIEKIKQEVKPILNRLDDDSLSLIIYNGSEQLTKIGSEIDEKILNTALAQSGEHYYVLDHQALYTKNIGDYQMMIGNTNFYADGILNQHDYSQFKHLVINVMSLILFIIIATILMTNLLLTRMMVRSIMIPLNILVSGVHQLGEGNLDYRIIYHGRDEFLAVCQDFNDMAGHLQRMVQERQKDDENRRELIAGISHDLRTPLTSIKGYVIGLEEGIDTSPLIRKRYLEILKNKTNDLEHLVNQLFLFSKIDLGDFPLNLEQINIGMELDRYFHEVKDEYSRQGLAIQMINNTTQVVIDADRMQLRNVLMNILENAVKYGNQEHKKISISCVKKDDQVMITMLDNGAGVPAESIGNLFDVFYRTDKSRQAPEKGSGLGLAMSAKIINKLKGKIYAENADGGGLAIVLLLPIVSEERSHGTYIDHRR